MILAQVSVGLLPKLGSGRHLHGKKIKTAVFEERGLGRNPCDVTGLIEKY